MRKVKLGIAIALLALATIVVLQNTEPVETQVLWIHMKMPRVLLLGLTLVAGVAIGFLLSEWRHRRKA